MGTKKGQRRKTARRAYEPKRSRFFGSNGKRWTKAASVMRKAQRRMKIDMRSDVW
jgi:hypothetical protein